MRNLTELSGLLIVAILLNALDAFAQLMPPPFPSLSNT